MIHGSTRRTSNYIEMNLTDVGCTVTVRCPAKRALEEAERASLCDLLCGQQDVVDHLCSDLLEDESTQSYDGGEIDLCNTKGKPFCPLTVRRPTGPMTPPRVFEQGRDRLAAALARYSDDEVRIMSVVSDIDLYLIYTDLSLSDYIGAMRAPLTTLSQLASDVSHEQGPTPRSLS